MAAMAPSAAARTATEPKRRALSSVSNSLTVLEFLIEVDEAGVSEIARHVGVTVGTSHRLLATLVATGWAEQNPSNRKYRPSQKVVRLARKMRLTISPREIAHSHLVQLAARVHETGNLAILQNSQILYVDKVTSDQPFGVEARIGSRLPAYCTALGKTLLADLDGPELDEYIGVLARTRAAKQLPTPPSATAFRAELRRTRTDGYALDLGEYLPDVFCVAAPITGSEGRAVAAFSVSAPKSRFEVNRKKLIEAVQDAAAKLSAELADLGFGNAARELASPELS